MCHYDVLLLPILQKPVPLPPENPYPWPRVRVFEGRGKGRRFIPVDNPCHSLSMILLTMTRKMIWDLDSILR